MSHRKNTIKIDGEKLKRLLEKKTGLSLYEISENCGYSNKLLYQACSEGYASSTVQNVARLYGIAPEDYKVEEIPESPCKPHNEPKQGEQLSFNEFIFITPEEVKKAVKDGVTEAITEILPDIVKGIIDNLPAFINKEV